MFKLFFSILLFLQMLVSSAQGEANIWYFGNHAGLDFNSGSPVALTDGQINTQESCGSIADASGQLIFYTDGRSVFARNHTVMPNGTGLLGNESASQSGTIVPKPGSSTLFYVFTTANEHDPDGFRYTVVDMSLNGGFGAVTAEKNVQVFTPSLESIAVIKKANNIDFWVVGHGWNSNNFYSYSLTAAGLSATPVTSAVGAIITGIGFQAAAVIKIAPSGSKLAFTSVADVAQLFDFNTGTGVVSNPITLSTETGELYGIEFSPDETRLYVANSFYKIYQYDLTASDIPNSKLTLYNGPRVPGVLQLGPDGKIYIAVYGQNQMGVINNPNTLGIGCDLQMTAIDLAGKVSSLGLPAFNRSFFDTSFRAENLCFGSATQFNLTSTVSVTSAIWNFGDASSPVNSISSSHTYALAGTYPVTVTVTSTAGTVTKSKSITISDTPVIASPIVNQSVCGSASMSYDLTQFNTTVLGSQSTAIFGVAYFASMADATNHSSVLPTNYNLPIGATTFFAKVFNLSNLNCYVVTNFIVTLSQQPTATAPSDFIICENLPYDSIEVFDLSTKNSQILNGQNASAFSVSYHISQSDADLNTAVLPTLYTNTLPQETLYVRVENSNTTTCYATTILHLSVVHQPQIVMVSDFVICDDSTNDGIANFNLIQKTTEILNGQSASAFEVKYYYSLAEAQNNLNEITTPINNTSSNQTIYYSITAIGNVGCRAVSSFKLIVTRLPMANTPNPLFICDDVSNDGIGQFDLSTNTNQILGTQSTSLFTVSYHLNQNDADIGLNDLILNYQNISNPQTIFARVENNQNSSCFATTSFQIGLNTMPIAFQPLGLTECDDDTNDGKALFDLSQQTAAVLDSQSSTEFAVSYHTSLADANLGNNDLSLGFTNTSNPQTIYARIENNTSPTCFAITSFQLQVKAAPVLIMDEMYSNCEGNVVTIVAPLGFSSYNWSNGATTSSTSIATAGNYSLTVTRDYGTISCPTTKNFSVYNSNKATITAIETRDWTDNQNMIIVQLSSDGKGDYEYSLDGVHYQDSNVFEGLPSGQYTVYVNDKKGCGEVTEDLFLLMYPKFFTPNGDGINDIWRIRYSNIEPNMELQIYDRYGKLITVFNGLDFGWDGFLNGKLQFSDDYWFVVKRQNGKEFRGHFSLLR